MNDGITDEKVKAILESTESRRKNLEIIREDNWLLKTNKWGNIVTVCVIVLMLLAMKIWIPLSFAEIFANPAVCMFVLLFVVVICTLTSKISHLEGKHSALVAFMESEHFFDKEDQSQQETPGDK